MLHHAERGEVDHTECHGWGCIVLTQVEGSSNKGSNVAGVGVSTAGMANNFPSLGILLGGEGQHSKSGKAELCDVSCGSRKCLVANFELNILKVEGLIGC